MLILHHVEFLLREKLIVAGADPNMTTLSGSSILHVADPMKQHEIKAVLSGLGG